MARGGILQCLSGMSERERGEGRGEKWGAHRDGGGEGKGERRRERG